MDKTENKSKSLKNGIAMIEIRKDDLIGEYIVIKKDPKLDRDSVVIKAKKKRRHR